ncbi:E3 SUMO-protein ligase KIAA1586-like [Lissotriton helveticus]
MNDTNCPGGTSAEIKLETASSSVSMPTEEMAPSSPPEDGVCYVKIEIDSDSEMKIIGEESDDQHTALSQKCKLPNGWNPEQYNYYTWKYPWLIVNGATLGCAICHQVSRCNGAEKFHGIKLSREWSESTICSYGANKEKQQKSLRKKMTEHSLTKAHNTAAKILEEAKGNSLLHVTAKAQSVQLSRTSRVFRTAYQDAKQNRPAFGFEAEIECQQLNGLDMGRILHSNVACSNIQQHISSEMKKKMFAKITSLAPKVGLLLDETTSLNKKFFLIVYLRIQLAEMKSPANVFVDLIDLTDLSPEGVVNSLFSALKKHPVDISEDFLSKCLVSVTCDGESVICGRESGVVKLLQEKVAPNIVVWYCSAHRLELIVNEVMKEIEATNSFKNFIDKLYFLFNTSLKNSWHLQECAEALHIQLSKIGKVIDTNWVSSSCRTVEAVWNAYPSLYKHFITAAGDTSRDSTTRNMYTALSRELSSVQFIANLGIIYDALQALSELSLELQKHDITIIDADRALCQQIAVFEAMVDKRGIHSSECEQAIKENMFQGVTLHAGKTTKNKKVEHENFFRSLVDHLRKRLSTGGDEGVNDNARFDTLISEVTVLYKQFWPQELPSLYGESEIASLCERFDIAKHETIQAYREYKDSGGKEVKKPYEELLTTVNTISISTVECQQGISQLNLIYTSGRASLHTDTISSLLFLNLVGPPLTKFNPDPYVQAWIDKGRRAADDIRSKERKQTDPDSTSALDAVWALMDK